MPFLSQFAVFVDCLDVGFGADWQLAQSPRPNWIVIGVFELSLERGHVNNRRRVSDETRRIGCGPMINIANQWTVGRPPTDVQKTSQKMWPPPKHFPKDVGFYKELNLEN